LGSGGSGSAQVVVCLLACAVRRAKRLLADTSTAGCYGGNHTEMRIKPSFASSRVATCKVDHRPSEARLCRCAARSRFAGGTGRSGCVCHSSVLLERRSGGFLEGVLPGGGGGSRLLAACAQTVALVSWNATMPRSLCAEHVESVWSVVWAGRGCRADTICELRGGKAWMRSARKRRMRLVIGKARVSGWLGSLRGPAVTW
jgi:hypothetical protein